MAYEIRQKHQTFLNSLGTKCGGVDYICRNGNETEIAVAAYLDLIHELSLFKGWHSNIFCTMIFVFGQDESQGTTTVKSEWSKVKLLLVGQESTSHFT